MPSKQTQSAAILGLLIATIQLPAFSQTQPDQSFVINSNGIDYNIDTYGSGKTYYEALNTIQKLGLDFQKTAIWNDFNKALGIAQETATAGYNKAVPNPYYDTWFPYNGRFGTPLGISDEVNSIGTLYSPGGINYFDYSPSYSNRTPKNGWAVVNAIPQAQSIIQSGNVNGGNANNKTSNLGSSLLPQFEGGTLTVDQANATITDNFTLDSSATNSIDANGNEASFSGVFSDAASGTPGNIRFENSVVGNNKTITLTGNSSYTGNTSIGPRVFLALRGTGSINNSSDLTIERGGRLNIETNAGTSHTLRNVTGGGDLQPNSGATVEINRSGVRFDGRLQTIPGSVTKTGTETWTLTNPDSHVHGGVTVAEGAWIMDGGSFDGKAPWTPVTVLPGARFAVTSGTTTNTGTFTVGGAGNRSHLEINGNLRVNGHLNLEPRSRILFNWNDGTSGPRARELHVGGTLNHNGESIDSRGGDYLITVNSLQGKSNILVDGETLTLTTRNDSPFDGKIGDFNPGQQGGTLIKSGQGTLSLSQSGGITNLNNLQVNEGTLALLNGGNAVNTATTISPGAALKLSNSSSSLTSTTVDVNAGGLLTGNGTIVGNVTNNGEVKPGGGGAIGTLTVDGDYYQGITNPNATLNIEVDGSTSDLLKITGDNRFVALGGNLKISSLPNTHITPNNQYTAIDITGQGATGGELNLKTDRSGVIGSSGYLFARETDPAFATLDQSYYDICTSSDPDIQKGCTKLKFAWLQRSKQKSGGGTKQVLISPSSSTQTPVVVPTTQSPQAVINTVKKSGGAITTASSGNTNTNTDICTANTGNNALCRQQNQSGSGLSASNTNNQQVARTIDAGQASLGAVVSNGTTGGDPVKVNGVNSGYTTNQTQEAKVTPDFVSVYNALFSIPTRQQLNQALHSITAEPYASMQSVALEAIEQFGKNSLALTDRSVPLTHKETFCKQGDGTLIPADSPERPDTCNERTKTVGSRWSLLLDGTNTEASLDGTNDLASLDYNVFSTIYGLQYAFSPEWSAGAAFGYGQANLYNYEYANSRIQSDTYGGSLWGIYRPSADWKFSGLLGYMNLQYDSNRNMAFGGLNRTAEANWDGNGFTAALDAQYNWALNGNNTDPNAIRLKPRTFLSYAVHNQGSFSESGAQSLNLNVDSHTADSLLWGIGFTLETPIRLSSTNRLIPRFTVGYEYDFMGDADEEHQLTSSFSELPALGSVDVLGQNRGANALDLGLSIEIETSDSVSLYAGVNGGFWSNGTEVSYGGGLKYSW